MALLGAAGRCGRVLPGYETSVALDGTHAGVTAATLCAADSWRGPAVYDASLTKAECTGCVQYSGTDPTAPLGATSVDACLATPGTYYVGSGVFGQSAANTVGSYMNPYNNAVTDNIARLGARNLQENLMPAVNSDYIRAGQYGSTNMMAQIGRDVRDTNDDILGKQADVLQQGYGQAMTSAQNDLQRYGQLGQTAGQLSNSDSQMQLDGAKVSGALGQIAQGARYNDINALGAVGNSQQAQTQSNLDLAHQDFVDQRDYQANQLAWENNLIKGYQMPTSSYTSDSGPLAGATFQPGAAQSAIGAGLATYNLLK